jgi:tRNA nucleotidyltransferase (CCA-adding enzyme)
MIGKIHGKKLYYLREKPSKKRHMPTFRHDQPIPDEVREAAEASKEKKEHISSERFPSPEEYIGKLRELGYEGHAKAYEKVIKLVAKFEEHGGQAYLVGGVVRDALFGKISKDFDIEVYGVEPAMIQEIVNIFAQNEGGKKNEVGEAFGILKVGFGEDIDIDISLPRRDSTTGAGHKDFAVDADPHMSIEEAALRRDFTFNAMAAHPVTGDIFDPYGGVEDAKKRILRVTDEERFADDPLRILRAVQFIGRFGLEVDPESMKIMQGMVPELKHISPERFKEEWKKLFLKSEKPSIGLSTAMTLGVLREMHPQFLEMKQEHALEEHGETDMWVHTLASVDQASIVSEREGLGEKEATTLMLAAFAGNLTRGDMAGGRASETGERTDVSPVKRFMKQISMDNKTRDAVLALVVSRHMPGKMFVQDRIQGQAVTDGQIRRLAEQIHPATIEQLVLLSEADHLGRGVFEVPEHKEGLMLPRDSFPARDWLLERARALGIHDSKPGNVLEGKHLIAFGYKPGREFGQIMKLAIDLRDEKAMTRDRIFVALDGITDPKEAITKLEELLGK